MMRFLWLVAGFHYVPIKGKQATRKQAPILALAPHSSFVDILPVVKMSSPTIVARNDIGEMPIFGSMCYHASSHLCVSVEKKKMSLVMSFSPDDRADRYRSIDGSNYRIIAKYSTKIWLDMWIVLSHRNLLCRWNRNRDFYLFFPLPLVAERIWIRRGRWEMSSIYLN